MSLNDVVDAIRNNRPVCLFDFPSREAETDVLYIGRSVEAADVDFIRRMVGGPLALYVSGDLCERLQISTFVSMITNLPSPDTLQRLVLQNHGHDPRFAISLDFRQNRTGCSPAESARTASKLFELAVAAPSLSDSDLQDQFVTQFVSPGHVPVIRIARSLEERTGHAELSAVLARLANVPEFIVAGELIDPGTLESMAYGQALRFAEAHDLPLATGEEVLAAVERT